MANIPVADGVKFVIEINQDGTPAAIYVAGEATGSPLNPVTKPRTDSGPHAGMPPLGHYEVYRGNCVFYNGQWYCA